MSRTKPMTTSTAFGILAIGTGATITLGGLNQFMAGGPTIAM